MKLSEIYGNAKNTVISYEIFPPKGEGDEYKKNLDKLFLELNKLKEFNPQLISVTYGAGGSTREKTFDLVLKINNELKIPTMPHFTCVNSTKEQILEYIKKVEKNGIKNILALRGDPPMGEGKFKPIENGFSYASELVEFIAEHTDFSIGVAGYPEKHPEAVSLKDDIEHLQVKVEKGADVIYTQLFFDNDDFYKYCNQLSQHNIDIPVIPGIMIIQSFKQIERIAELSCSKVPGDLYEKLVLHQDDSDYIKKLGIEFAVKQVSELLKFGVKGLHFYTLDKAYATSKVLSEIF